MFIEDGHLGAQEDIIGWMILSGEDIAEISCFLVGLVTGDDRQYDHGDDSHKRMTGDNWQNNHRDDSQCRETGSCCNRCSGRLGPKANLLIYEVVQCGHHEERLLLQESIKRTKEFKKKQLSDQENDLSHKSVTCPGKEGVTIHIMLLKTFVQRRSMKISMCKIHRYQCMCKTVASLYAVVKTQRRILR